MMPTCFHIRLGPASLAIADLVDYYGEGLIITRINVPVKFRGQGHGRALLQQITDAADKHATTLWLEVGASDGLDSEQLRRWYLRHGFRDVGGILKRPAVPHK